MEDKRREFHPSMSLTSFLQCRRQGLQIGNHWDLEMTDWSPSITDSTANYSQSKLFLLTLFRKLSCVLLMTFPVFSVFRIHLAASKSIMHLYLKSPISCDVTDMKVSSKFIFSIFSLERLTIKEPNAFTIFSMPFRRYLLTTVSFLFLST